MSNFIKSSLFGEKGYLSSLNFNVFKNEDSFQSNLQCFAEKGVCLSLISDISEEKAFLSTGFKPSRVGIWSTDYVTKGPLL